MSLQIFLTVQSAIELGRGGAWDIAVFQLAASVLVLAGLMAIFRKAGQPPLACVVPVLAEVKLLAIVDRPLYWLVALLVPVVDAALLLTTGDPLPPWTSLVPFVAQLALFVLLSARFGKGTGFYLGMVFFSFVFLPVLGFGSAEYKPPFRSRRSRTAT